MTKCQLSPTQKVVEGVIMKHLKLFLVLTHWHSFVLLTEVLLKVTPHCDSLQQSFPETPGRRLPGTETISVEKWNKANTETSICNHQKQSIKKNVTLSNWNNDRGLY